MAQWSQHDTHLDDSTRAAFTIIRKYPTLQLQKGAARGASSNFRKEAYRFAVYPRLTLITMIGEIKRLTDKGFGFITPDEAGQKDVFFHTSALVGVTYSELRVGDKVTFEVQDSEKGPRAANVQRA